MMPSCRALPDQVAGAKLAVDGQVEDDKVAPRSCDFHANANGPDMLRFERFFLADEQSLIRRSLVSADGTYKRGGSSATPPSASLYRERIILRLRNSLFARIFSLLIL
jgi:hypothetical protein